MGGSPQFRQCLDEVDPIFKAFHIKEPQLVFGENDLSVDPKDGISRFGPYGWQQSPDKTIEIGIIGTADGIHDTQSFLKSAQSRIAAGFSAGKRSSKRPLDPHTYPDFPGANSNETFRTTFSFERRGFQRAIPEEYFGQAISAASTDRRIKNVVELLIRELKALDDLERAPDVVIIVLPPSVEQDLAHVGAAMQKRKVKISPEERFLKALKKVESKGQMLLDIDYDTGPKDDQNSYWNIHHAFKARAMGCNVPTQWLWESTLRDPCLSAVAWNFFTAIYYKAGTNPWKLHNLPDNTCFVGISFYKERPVGDSPMHGSLAQVFGAGEGLVLQGDKAIVDKSRGDSSAHLSEKSAEALLKQAIEIYSRQHNAPPSRVVVHKTSRYWPEELEGFKKGLGDIRMHDFLAFGEYDTRFLRVGRGPVLRGTMVTLARRNYLLFTNGYIPFLRCYPSKRIPRPLEITEHHGHSTPLAVCEEIMCLTKLNWNSSTFASGFPITLRFAKQVGRVLAEFPRDGSISLKNKYRYFM